MRLPAAIAVLGITPAVAAAQGPASPAGPPAIAPEILLNQAVFARPHPLALDVPFAAPPVLAAGKAASAPLVLGGRRLALSVQPFAGLGPASAGGPSMAGAVVRVGSVRDAVQSRLRALGVKDGGDAYRGQGRFYLFAAVRGQAVGLNLQTAGGQLHRAGWSTDAASALVGDGQVGVGWRKGGLEADLGYVHSGVRIRNAPLGVSDSYGDDRAALSVVFRPRW